MESFQSFLKSNEVVFLDGAMGTELQNRGYETTLPLWSSGANLDAIEMVEDIHRDYVDAGADIITANTFRTKRYTFNKMNNPENADNATQNAVIAALNAKHQARRPVFVAGSISPLEDCCEPDAVPSEAVLKDDHLYQAQYLSNLGVDILLCETVNLIREARVMAHAASEAGLPFMMSFIVNENGSLLSGESIISAVASIERYNPAAILVNCAPLQIIDPAVQELQESYDGHIGVYANGRGSNDTIMGWAFHGNERIEEYADYCQQWVGRGVKIIGGCCGTSPAYIRAVKERVCPDKVEVAFNDSRDVA